jgi:hypothetical protein
LIEIFRKLLPEDREKVLQKGLQDGAQFVFKSPQKAVRVKLNNLKRPNYITCNRPAEVASLRTKEDVIVVMVLDDERYFFMSFAFVDDGFLFFKRKVDFFHLVRRKNKRLKFPANFEAILMIKKLNGNLSFLRGIVSDFSDTGCRLGLITELPKIGIGDQIVGNLKMGDKRSIEITAVVKHHEKSRAGATKQTFGLNFVFPTSHAKNMVKSLFLDLQRELFVEFYGKK